MLSDQEKELVAACRQRVLTRRRSNTEALSYYDGTAKVKNLDIAVPPTLAQIGVVSDWPATVVNTHVERMNFEAWADSGRFGMDELADQLQASSKIAEAVLDSAIFGVAFLALEHDGEQWHLRSVSPLEGTLLWDANTGRPYAGYRRGETDTGDAVEVLYLPGRNVVIRTGERGTTTAEYATIPGEVVIHRVRNGMRSRRWYGASMITPAVRYYTDAAARTLLGMEVNREFYTTPQRYALNADMSLFTESDNPSRSEMIEAGWRATAGTFLTVPPPEDGDPETKLEQFTPASPEPYVAQLRTYSQLIASASGIPSSYLGFSTDNPPSGDAIRAWMDRLIRRVEGQHKVLSPDMRRLGWNISMLLGERVEWEAFARSVSEQWTSPATVMLGAAADAGQKLVAAGVLGKDSSVLHDLLGLTSAQRRQLAKEQRSDGLERLRKTIEAKGAPEPSAEAIALADKRGEA